MDLDTGTSKPKRINKCSACKQPGHNKNSLLCVARSAIGSAVPAPPAQNIAALEEKSSDDDDNDEDYNLDVVNDI